VANGRRHSMDQSLADTNAHVLGSQIYSRLDSTLGSPSGDQLKTMTCEANGVRRYQFAEETKTKIYYANYYITQY